MCVPTLYIHKQIWNYFAAFKWIEANQLQLLCAYHDSLCECYVDKYKFKRKINPSLRLAKRKTFFFLESDNTSCAPDSPTIVDIYGWLNKFSGILYAYGVF